jgi:hypothetical protein
VACNRRSKPPSFLLATHRAWQLGSDFASGDPQFLLRSSRAMRTLWNLWPIRLCGDRAGKRRDGMLITVDRKKGQAGAVPEKGQTLWTTCANGRRMFVTVADVSGRKVMLDTNHPLAGKVITFEIHLARIL